MNRNVHGENSQPHKNKTVSGLVCHFRTTQVIITRSKSTAVKLVVLATQIDEETAEVICVTIKTRRKNKKTLRVSSSSLLAHSRTHHPHRYQGTYDLMIKLYFCVASLTIHTHGVALSTSKSTGSVNNINISHSLNATTLLFLETLQDRVDVLKCIIDLCSDLCSC